ncbi:asparagine synthetase domain-containing protein 1-like isoform X2 [Asparagus officinalis]|uniref:asparagine synthetase domain-containing protein 1-like isoform X2 n=1 Tax=Asparagus officinalis TaxID=4686 RepID=UPI00098E5C4B|nr:asparagine synthetase domain-containing protein 1-like isoform X2 [Asparagus officinalis]
MCGIALVLSGVRILGSDLHSEPNGGASHPTAQQVDEPVLLLDDLKASLLRRGPDSIGSRKILLHLKCNKSDGNDDERGDKEEDLWLQAKDNSMECIVSSVEPCATQDVRNQQMPSDAEIELVGATLQLRGIRRVFQPLEDVSRNLLVYNGEIFGGIHVADRFNDGQALLDELGNCCSCGFHEVDPLERFFCCNAKGKKSVPEILSTIRGPWALIYWQEESNTIWFGRDAFGRRSLLVHWPTFDDSRFVLSSVSALSSVRNDSVSAHSHIYWEELPCGIYSVNLKASGENNLCIKEKIFGQVVRHGWADSLLNRLTEWERTNVEPSAEELSLHKLSFRKTELQSKAKGYLMETCKLSGCMQPAQKVLFALKESVLRRTAINSVLEKYSEQDEDELVPVALLFSGGLDSMILAALLDQCLNPRYIIDLLNVSFDGQLAPDRVSARMGVKELQRIAPSRRWRLVEIDSTLSGLTWEIKHLRSLIHPAKTYMDINIGIALWLAAGGDGWVDGEICSFQDEPCRYRYKSSAKVLFVGSGADEQCAGYGRHKTKYRKGGWFALQEEMKLDMQRIWRRNLGRDDRCISDHGKEARFPFLDEDVIKSLLELPLWEIAELDEPAGRGDKKILREVARLLGIEGASLLPKRAIQFGSRIARESNRKTFGSNRAANQASAGSVEISEK